MKIRRACTYEIRSDGSKLYGYAAVFGAEANIGGGVVETIAPGAFSSSLSDGRDILALVDHDPARVLARTKSGTLRLFEDEKGLAFELSVPDTQAGKDVLTLAKRGDLGGMSFGFSVIDEALDGDRRELRVIELFEISVVAAWPAYDGTEVFARSSDRTEPLSWHGARLRILEVSQ